MKMSHYPDYWNDDDRDVSYVTYKCSKPVEEDEYIPVYRIIKEMYDEDKEAMYCTDDSHSYSSYQCFRNYDDEWMSEDDRSDVSDADDYEDDDSSVGNESTTVPQNEIFEDYVYKRFCYY